MPIVPPHAANLAAAVAALRASQLVGMPTETVYGVAAIAGDAVAVARTFAAKQRPGDNPLIVHLAGAEELHRVAREVSAAARRLAAMFWPGPLTLVLPRQPHVLPAVTAGLDTVAVRVPAHPVALDLLRAVGEPLSAPSANTFQQLSPTTAADIEPELLQRLALVLDGGACTVGIESTVVDCTGAPRVLRPGGIPRAAIEAALGIAVPLAGGEATGARHAPGLYARHYAPRTPVAIAASLAATDVGLTFAAPAGTRQIEMPDEPAAYAASLYRVLHALDQLGAERIVVQAVPGDRAWEAVRDRLQKAAAPPDGG